MECVGLFEAKTRLSELVARAESGGEVVITRHNRPVAKIVAYEAGTAVDLQRRLDAVKRLQALGAAIAARGGPVTEDEIGEWIREGRR
jgi:prevent-host-death family protein